MWWAIGETLVAHHMLGRRQLQLPTVQQLNP